MTIDELMQRLTAIRATHGNLSINAEIYGHLSKIVTLVADGKRPIRICILN